MTAFKRIVEAVDSCLVRTYIEKFYAGKSCAGCGDPIGHIDWNGPMPAAIDAHGEIITWNKVATDRLPGVLTGYRPLCRECQVDAGSRESVVVHFPSAYRR